MFTDDCARFGGKTISSKCFLPLVLAAKKDVMAVKYLGSTLKEEEEDS
jgi:hypothetical protein